MAMESEASSSIEKLLTAVVFVASLVLTADATLVPFDGPPENAGSMTRFIAGKAGDKVNMQEEFSLSCERALLRSLKVSDIAELDLVSGCVNGQVRREVRNGILEFDADARI